MHVGRLSRGFRIGFLALAVSLPLAGAQEGASAALDRAIEQALVHRRNLEEYQEKLDTARSAELEQIRSRQNQAAGLAGELQLLEPGSPQTDALYDKITEALLEAMEKAIAALGAASRSSDVPVSRSALDPAAVDAPAVAGKVERLNSLEAENSELVDRLVRLETAHRWELVNHYGAIVGRLDSLRLLALGDLSDARRDAVLGLSRDGLDHFVLELGLLRFSEQLYIARSSRTLGSLPSRMGDLFVLGEIAWTALKITLIVLVFGFIGRRRRTIAASMRKLAHRKARTDKGWRRMSDLLDLSGVLAPWVFFLLLLAALRWSLSAVARPEIDLVFRIAFIYGVYRLSIDLLYEVSLRGVKRHRLPMDPDRSRALLGCVRAVVRVGFGIVVLFVISRALLGPGYLYHLAVRSTWFIVLVASLVLIFRWRRTIADTFLQMRGDKRLAPVVRASRDRWYGVFISAGAFVFLAGYALAVLARDFAMGFDQTRRALAFAFRRRVERSAQQTGYADTRMEELPSAVREAFSENPIGEGDMTVEHFPGLDRLHSMIEEWREGDLGASFLLSGEKGIGKTSWLSRIDGMDVPVGRTEVTNRVHDVDALARVLGHSLNLSADSGVGGLRKALLSGPKRIEVVDLAQNLFLGKVGGYDTFEAFVSLVEATCNQVFWVCSISAFACDHVFAVRPDLMIFRDHQALSGWSEEAIRDLIKSRTAASGIEVTYDDLLLGRVAFDDDAALGKEAEDGYLRLLWDHSDGNPRAALHFWLRSLVPRGGDAFSVKLFRAPAGTELDRLGNRPRFLLAAIVVHENLTLTEAATVTRYPTAVCRLQLERLKDRGILRRERERYRLTTHWHRTVVRFLKRVNLLSD